MSNATDYLGGLADYNLAELGTFFTVVLGSFAGCMVAVLKGASQSRCTRILWGCCERLPVDEEEVSITDDGSEQPVTASATVARRLDELNGEPSPEEPARPAP